MKKFVAYCRTSTENQREEKTIELQVESLSRYAKSHGIEIVEWFKDDGVSGGLENRPALAKMLKFLEVNVEVEAVLIYKLDRLARDLYLQEGLIREFTKFKKIVISTIEPDLASNDPFRKAFRQFIGIVSELEKAIITLRMKNGRDSSVSKGRWHGGLVYGYDSKDGKLTINEREAEIIKKIFYFRRYKKMTASEIANFLNHNKIPTKRGNTNWWPSSVNKILSNKMYRKGLLKYKNQEYQGRFETIL
jgi:site-specific DNA recombinase